MLEAFRPLDGALVVPVRSGSTAERSKEITQGLSLVGSKEIGGVATGVAGT